MLHNQVPPGFVAGSRTSKGKGDQQAEQGKHSAFYRARASPGTFGVLGHAS